eukprot:1159714-Pelagomonas_calceolata.AAC.4
MIDLTVVNQGTLLARLTATSGLWVCPLRLQMHRLEPRAVMLQQAHVTRASVLPLSCLCCSVVLQQGAHKMHTTLPLQDA